jgi:hypothetical protein
MRRKHISTSQHGLGLGWSAADVGWVHDFTISFHVLEVPVLRSSSFSINGDWNDNPGNDQAHFVHVKICHGHDTIEWELTLLMNRRRK